MSIFIFQVTADIHAIHATAYQIVIAIFTVSNLVRAGYGTVSVWPTFLLIEMSKMGFVFFIGVGNISAFVQVAIIFDIRCCKFVKSRNLHLFDLLSDL